MALNSGKILMRRGQEINFDPNKMTPGEWAVSLDSKFVRMCFSPGVCVRMATYDAFEADMVQIQRILEECQTIEEAVNRINDEISVKAQAVAEYTAQAKQYRDEAQQFRNEAFSSTPEGYLDLVEQVGENTRKIAEGAGGVSSYTDLENKPKINNVELDGNKTLDELGIASKEALEETDNKVNIIIENADLGFKETASGENIHLDDSADSKLVEFALYGKATQDGTPTPENPIDIVVAGSSGNVEVKSCGKNLLLYPYNEKTKTVNGITFTDNGNGTITANGTATGTATIFLYGGSGNVEKNIFKNNILSGCPSGGSAEGYNLRAQGFDTETTSNGTDYVDNGDGVIIGTKDYIRIYIRIASGTKLENIVFKPMIRLATDTDATYEPYKETTCVIPTPNGLAGIPVESDGNYTDENGQQWICDEVVKYADGSGEYIKRIKKILLDSNNSNTIINNGLNNGGKYVYSFNEPKVVPYSKVNNGLSSMFKHGANFHNSNECFYCNDGKIVEVTRFATLNEFITFVNKNPITFIVATEPIRTPLTAEQLAEIEKLKTFYPITNISNDADCGMKVKYIADAKSYIDNRLALIEQAMLNSI